MVSLRFFIAGLFSSLLAAAPLHAEEPAKGTIFTLWPLLDYRESPAEGYRNISILGPILKFQKRGDDRVNAVRPLFYEDENLKERSSTTTILYPLAGSTKSPDTDTFEVLQLFQTSTFRKDEGARREKGTTLFPFYVSGTSEKYGPYRAVVPFYGDIYERFWRDEYHFVMFPLYGRTVKKGTTTSHYLWPFFSRTSGENESGFQLFPLYGQEHKEGVYRKRFVLWPLYTTSDTGLDTDNPVRRKFFFPVYAATDSPMKTSRSYMWPFFGYTDDRAKKYRETDYFYPFIRTVRGEDRTSDVYLPFYARMKAPERDTRWYLWPLYKHETTRSDIFNREQDRVFYFLYRADHESWPKDGSDRQRTALWPLFLYSRTPQKVSSFSFPAPVESVLDKEGIEKNWAPLWRIYQRRWDDRGNSASTFLWNLFWHERRGEELAFEVFPLVRYDSEHGGSDLRLLKGLIRYKASGPERELSLFWLPLGLKWGAQ